MGDDDDEPHTATVAQLDGSNGIAYPRSEAEISVKFEKIGVSRSAFDSRPLAQTSSQRDKFCLSPSWTFVVSSKSNTIVVQITKPYN